MIQSVNLDEQARRYLTDLMGEPALRSLMELPSPIIDAVITTKIRERGLRERTGPHYSLATGVTDANHR